MHAHRVEVLDRAHDDHVVDPVADDLELELVPAPKRLLDENLSDRRLQEPSLDLLRKRLERLRKAAAVSAERERGPDDRRQGDAAELVERSHDRRGRHVETAPANRRPELFAILGSPDDLHRRADELDAELVQDAAFRERDREVESSLPPERRQ